MSERRHLDDRRQRGLRIVPVELPAPVEEAPFLRPNRRTRVRRARRGWMWRSILLLEATGGALVLTVALWASYAKVMASERLRVGNVEVRGSHFLSEGEVRELLGPAVGENILGLDIQALKARLRSSPWVRRRRWPARFRTRCGWKRFRAAASCAMPAKSSSISAGTRRTLTRPWR